jgi:uncharacterized protein (TIGR02147 family)
MEYARKLLNKEFEDRQSRNSRYSLRAFARDLGIDSSSLSQVLSGKRKLTPTAAAQVADKLKLPTSSRRRFFLSFGTDVAELAEAELRVLQDQQFETLITDWRYYAVLNLILIKAFDPTLKRIARAMRMSEEETKEIIETLEYLGFLKVDSKGRYSREAPKLDTARGTPSEIIRKAHSEELKLALKRLMEVPLEKRFFTSRTFAINSKNLPQARELIRKFRTELSALLEDGDEDEVYLFAVQLFPLTEDALKNPKDWL